ncbi:hypothetical protein Q666_13430 [Marinobacter sp. ES-1]|nr:hypothetical protein Q666_13430 [Marinobacter sp. ES-1]
MLTTRKEWAREVSGALGDIGTLLPLSLGVIAVAGLAPVPVLLGFAVFYIATGLYYRLPIPVQPMKAVAALLLTTQVSHESLVASGILIGAIMLLLGVTGWINRVARLVPGSILSGLQLGLGLLLAGMSLGLMATSWLAGLATLLVLVFILWRLPAWPATLIGLGVSLAVGAVTGSPGLSLAMPDSVAFNWPELPGLSDWQQGFSVLALPQLALTLTNAILLTALLAGDYFGEQAHRASPARLSISTGLANLCLVPFGALPMCHGAGGAGGALSLRCQNRCGTRLAGSRAVAGGFGAGRAFGDCGHSRGRPGGPVTGRCCRAGVVETFVDSQAVVLARDRRNRAGDRMG